MQANLSAETRCCSRPSHADTQPNAALLPWLLYVCCCHVCCRDGTLAGQQAGALLLGVVNVVGVITLSSMLMDPIAKLSLYRQGLGFILGLLPYLQTYAAAFFAMPLLRLFVDGRRNVAIDDRNDNRIDVSARAVLRRHGLSAPVDAAGLAGSCRG